MGRAQGEPPEAVPVSIHALDGRGKPYDLQRLQGQVVVLTFVSRYVQGEGGRVNGAVGGLFYARGGWNSVALFIAAIFGTGLLAAWRLYHVPPLPIAPSPGTESALP